MVFFHVNDDQTVELCIPLSSAMAEMAQERVIKVKGFHSILYGTVEERTCAAFHTFTWEIKHMVLVQDVEASSPLKYTFIIYILAGEITADPFTVQIHFLSFGPL